MIEANQKLLSVIFGEALVDAFAETLVPGGAPFNVACHLAALGAKPLLISRLGDDAAGRLLRETAARCGLSLRGIQQHPATARVEVTEGPAGHVFAIGSNQAFDCIDAEAARQACAAWPNADWLYFGTLALRDSMTRTALASLRGERRYRVYVDLNWRQAGPSAQTVLPLLQQVEVLKVSDEELQLLLDWLDLPPSGVLPSTGERSQAIADIGNRLGLQHLLVSHGAAGASAWDARGVCLAHTSAPSLPRLVDTVGAGDAFSAMMLAGLLRGRSVATMLGQAVAFASLSCSWRGALPPTIGLYQSWCTLLDTSGAHSAVHAGA